MPFEIAPLYVLHEFNGNAELEERRRTYISRVYSEKTRERIYLRYIPPGFPRATMYSAARKINPSLEERETAVRPLTP